MIREVSGQQLDFLLITKHILEFFMTSNKELGVSFLISVKKGTKLKAQLRHVVPYKKVQSVRLAFPSLCFIIIFRLFCKGTSVR